MIRLFVALPLPETLRMRLAMLQAGVEGARWVPAENLHVTLRFIGDVQEDLCDDIVAALDAVAAPSLRVDPSGVGHFETGGRPHAIWAGVDRSPDLVALHEKIDRALVRTGLPPEGRKYAPHITLARVRRAKGNHLLDWLGTNGGFSAPPFEARSFTLFESRNGHYLPLAEFPLT